ncbi:MAG: caspase family protein [Acidobacteria bacterium]|nr:caspase family protein [Acidobacteriota bacterium]
MKTRLIEPAVLFLCLLLLTGAAGAQKTRQLVQEDDEKGKARTALVIGNGDYANARKLLNPANDAADMANALRALGFDVVSGTDLNLRQMNEKVREFGDKLRVNGGVGLFYYAGHGIQVGGQNFLIPVEAEIPREDEVDYNSVNLDLVLRKMATANNGLNIVILDACRNNPFARSWSRGADEGGLAQITAPVGTFIAYATSPDRTASDGTGRNGLYTEELLKVLNQPDLKIEEAFKQVTIAVDRASGGKQVPWTSSSLRGDFYFRPDAATVKRLADQPAVPAVAVKPPETPESKEAEAWSRIKDSINPDDFAGFLNQYPNGVYADQAKTRMIELYSKSNTPNGFDLSVFKAPESPLFLIDGDKRTQMKIAQSKQDVKGSAGVMGIGGSFKMLQSFNGGRALLRVVSPQPVFEYALAANLNPSDIVLVVRLKAKSDKREIQTVQKNYSGFNKDDVVPVAFEEVLKVPEKNKILYRIKFAAPLGPGEYAVVVNEPLGQELGMYERNGAMPGVFYDFGVDGGKSGK